MLGRPIIKAFLVLSLMMCIAGAKFAQTGAKSMASLSEQEIKIGKKYYQKYSCISCHGEKGKLQGDLTQAYKKYTTEEIIKYIKRPDTYKNFRMPVFNTVIPDTVYPGLVKYIKYLGEKANQVKK